MTDTKTGTRERWSRSMMALLLALSVGAFGLAGCSDGSDGSDGAMGPEGLQGPQGPAGVPDDETHVTATLKMTPALAACSSCHDDPYGKATSHMKDVGFSRDDLTQSEINDYGLEACSACHTGGGGVAPAVDAAHDLWGDREEVTVDITRIELLADDVEVEFTISGDGAENVVDIDDGGDGGWMVEAPLARLVTLPGGYQTWQSYTTRVRNPETADHDFDVLQAASAPRLTDLSGNCVPSGGVYTCTYTLGIDVVALNNTAPPDHYGDGTTYLWDDSLDDGAGGFRLTTTDDWNDNTEGDWQTEGQIQRLAVAITGERGQVLPASTFEDFVFDGEGEVNLDATTPEKHSVGMTACNSCHDREAVPGLAGHGGDARRTGVEYCTTCHNRFHTSGAAARYYPPRTLDLAYMAHEIHTGGGLSGEGRYIPQSVWDGVSFPQGMVSGQPRHSCASCHNSEHGAEAPERAYEKPTAEACLSCHTVDNWDGWAIGHNGNPYGSNCIGCHDSSGGTSVADLLDRVAAEHINDSRQWAIEKNLRYEVDSVDLDGTTVTVRWQALDGGTAIQHGEDGWSFRAHLLVGWGDGEDYTHSVGSRPGDPVSRGDEQNDADFDIGTGLYTSIIDLSDEPSFSGDEEMIVASVSGVASHGDHSNVTMATGVGYWGDGKQRRQVVAMEEGCLNCHAEREGVFSKHGAGSRHSHVDRCIICHNNNSTDIGRWTGNEDRDGWPEGKEGEQPTNFMYLIHSIHSAKPGYAILTGGPAGGPKHWEDVRYPSQSENCTKCHVEDSYQDFVDTGTLLERRGTTIWAGENPADVDN